MTERSEPSNAARRRKTLEARIYEVLLHWPERLDEMETRNEAGCRRLAERLTELILDESPPAD